MNVSTNCIFSQSEIPNNTMNEPEFNERLTDSITMMMKYAHRFTPDSDKAEELLQETMLKALTSKDKYRSDDNFNGWLRTIMHNTYLNMLRSRIIYLDER